LESAKRFLVEHRLTRLPAANPTARPLLVDMWYLWALVFDGGVCARLVHWGLGILLMLATVLLATPRLGRPWAWVAGGLVVLTPAVNQQMSLPAESVALAAFCTLALAAWCQAVLDGGGRRWLIVAGLMAGGAFGVHYAAALMAPALAAAWAWSALRRIERRRRLLHGAAVMILVALGGALLYRLLLLGPAARSACLASLSDYLGAAPLAAAPGLLLARRLRGLGMLLLAAMVYATLSFSLGGDARLLFPAIPVLSLGAVWVWIEIVRFPRLAQRIAAAALAVAIASSIALSLLRLPDALAVALGLEERDEYLLRHEPTFVAATIANHALRSDARLLSQERQAFYFDCPVTWEPSLGTTIPDETLSVPETVERLRRAGFTHLLLAETAAEPRPVTSSLRRVGDARPSLTDYSFRTADGSVRHYRLVMLR
jgi:hypothetical protein